MKKALLILLMLLLGSAAVLGMFPWREAILAGASPAALLQPAPSPTPSPSPPPRPTPVPTPTPLAEDPAANARMAWEALFTYPSHEAPIRVLALLDAPGSTGDTIYLQMLQEGMLQSKGVYYAQLPSPAPVAATSQPDAEGSGEPPEEEPPLEEESLPQAPRDPVEWTAQALAGIPVGLLDSIYAETPDLALAAYEALRAAERNDAVEVICAGITPEIIDAMRQDHFSMGAAAGVYENEERVVYSEEFRSAS